jgi:protein phosphatase
MGVTSPRTTLRSTDPAPLTQGPRTPEARVDAGAVSHAGHVRPNNEDQFYVTRLARSMETMLSSLPPREVPDRAEEINYLMIVADGMGGHAAGETASRLAIGAIASLAWEFPDWIFRVDKEHTPEIRRRARRVVEQISSILFELGQQDQRLRGMGSTLTAARSYGRDLLIVHVGDSRAYLLRSGRLHRLTKDHTYAQLLVDTGQIAASDAGASRVRHILTNAVGGPSGEVSVDIDLLRLEDGDRLLLCSDGLTDLVPDDTIATVLNATPASNDACQALLQLALDGGGKDNITVVVAGYSFPATR